MLSWSPWFPPPFLVQIMIQAATTGDENTVSEIIVYGDRVLREGRAEDPVLVAELVQAANRRYAELRAARDQAFAAFVASG